MSGQKWLERCKSHTQEHMAGDCGVMMDSRGSRRPYHEYLRRGEGSQEGRARRKKESGGKMDIEVQEI